MPKPIETPLTNPLTNPDDILARQFAEYLRSMVAPDVLSEVLSPRKDATVFHEYKDNCKGFAHDILGIDFWSKQDDVAVSVRDNRFTVVEAGHAVGKTLDASAIVTHWLCTRSPAKAVTSAPTHHQVNQLLWRYMRQFKNKATKKLPGEIFETPRWEFPDKLRFAVGLSPRKDSEIAVASLQGYHDENLIVVLDEAAGLSKYLWDVAMSLVTGENNRLLAIGNPVGQSGPFYDATQSPNFKHIRISCLEHPNVKERKELIPGAVSYTWVAERVAEWCRPTSTPGEKSFFWEGKWYDPLPIFTARVLGIPAGEVEDQLIDFSWVDSAQKRWADEYPPGERIAGVDVARHGEDASVITVRVGDHVKSVQRQYGNDINTTVGWLMNTVKEEQIDHVFVDDTGVGGGVTDLARSLGAPVDGVHPQWSAAQRTKFSCVHDEIWWTVREKLRNGEMSLPDDDMLAADLVAVKVLRYDLQGRPVFEKKDDMKKRLGRSPDSGDALALSYYGTFPEMAGVQENYVEDLTRTVLNEGGGGQGSRWTVGVGKRGKSRWRMGN